MNEKLLSKGQAANLLGISSLKLDQLRKAGEVAFIKIGTRVLFRIDDLHDFIQRQRCDADHHARISEDEAFTDDSETGKAGIA